MAAIKLDSAGRKRLLSLARIVEQHFSSKHWRELGVLTGCEPIIDGHERLLRSLHFDDDYADCVFPVLIKIIEADEPNEGIIRSYLADEFDVAAPTNASATVIPIAPHVFQLPSGEPDSRLIAVMMPFRPEYESVFAALQRAAARLGLKCQRAKDIWRHEAVIQDIFDLIWRSRAFICDFSGKNSNVFYEAGIAHTLGRTEVPVTQAQPKSRSTSRITATSTISTTLRG